MTYLEAGLVALGLFINAQSLLFGLIRFFRLGRTEEPTPQVVTLILPVTGKAESLPAVVACLEAQTLAPRRLLLAVESRDDPAFAQATAVAAAARLPIEIVVAGLASRQAQKARNLLAAMERIDGSDQAVVLMDADIRPMPSWLATLIGPIARDQADIVTGQRWQRIARHTFGAHLVCMIDRAAFLMPRFKARITRVAWGGSVAIMTRAMNEMDLKGFLGRTLSDDLSLVDAAKAAGCSIATANEVLVPSPDSYGLVSGWRFACRQYRIVHIYRPWLWLLALSTVAARLAAWCLIVLNAQAGGPILWAGIAMAGLAVMKAGVVSAVGWRMGLPDPAPVLAGQIGLALIQPVVDLFHFSFALAAGFTRRIDWGHVSYRIDGPYDIHVIARRPHD